MLTLTNIHKSYEGKPLLKGISLDVAQGETLCLLGPSGSGKSTLLRIITGLEKAEAGDVLWAGKSIVHTPTYERNFGLIFQDYALFPHLNVFENVAFGLKSQKVAKERIRESVEEALKQVDLAGFEKRRVTDLSGGEQQRVALARALAPRPHLLLFDEPLGALDRKLREYLLSEIRNILRQTGVPAIYVTHDQEEAFTLADRVILLNDGKIIQEGTPADVYAHPRLGWVAEFLGAGNVLAGKRLGKGLVQTKLGTLEMPDEGKEAKGTRVSLLIRPENVRLSSTSPLKGDVADVLFIQNRYRVRLRDGFYF